MVDFNELTTKKLILDKFRPFSPELEKNLFDWFKIELTYTSNAIEGNTLTRQETAIVVEKGLTIEGKTLIEHQEALNHAKAFEYTHLLAKKTRSELTLYDILSIHSYILANIDSTNAGRLRSINVKISGSEVKFPSSIKVSDLMQDFIIWLGSVQAEHPVKIAADAHLKLVSIHPFTDGNGRTARLLMNTILMQQGYPGALIKNEDRRLYINAIEQAQLTGNSEDYYSVIYGAVQRSLDIYIEALTD